MCAQLVCRGAPFTLKGQRPLKTPHTTIIRQFTGSKVGADGITYSPAQSNNAYIFPALGHAASLCKAKEIFDEAFLMAAKALSLMASSDELKTGMLFPRFSSIRNVSSDLMAMVAADMCATGVGRKPKDFDEVTRRVTGGNDADKWRVYASQSMFTASSSSLECGGVQAGSRL